MMDQDQSNDILGESNANIEASRDETKNGKTISKGDLDNVKREKNNGEKSNKCNQCEFASAQAGSLNRHLKTHSGEKSNKCNQSDFASLQPGPLKRHLKTHSGEKAKPVSIYIHQGKFILPKKVKVYNFTRRMKVKVQGDQKRL